LSRNPEQGIEYLRARQFLDGRPGPTAKFLIARKGLSKQMVGEYLGGLPTPFLVQVLRYCIYLDASGVIDLLVVASGIRRTWRSILAVHPIAGCCHLA